MKPLLKQKLKEQLQSTRKRARNKETRTLGLEAKLILVKLFKIVYITIRQGAPLGLAVEIN